MTISTQQAIDAGNAKQPLKKNRRLLICGIAAVGALYFCSKGYVGYGRHVIDLHTASSSSNISKVESSKRGLLVSFQDGDLDKTVLISNTDPVDDYFRSKILTAAHQDGASFWNEISVPAAGEPDDKQPE